MLKSELEARVKELEATIGDQEVVAIVRCTTALRDITVPYKYNEHEVNKIERINVIRDRILRYVGGRFGIDLERT